MTMPSHPADPRQAYADLNTRMSAMARDMPGVMAGFGTLHAASQGPGVLDGKVKELMALVAAIVVHCDGCIVYHLHDALEAGATAGEVAETVGVAVMMGGGPAVVYGGLALEALGRFTADAT